MYFYVFVVNKQTGTSSDKKRAKKRSMSTETARGQIRRLLERLLDKAVKEMPDNSELEVAAFSLSLFTDKTICDFLRAELLPHAAAVAARDRAFVDALASGGTAAAEVFGGLAGVWDDLSPGFQESVWVFLGLIMKKLEE